MQGIRQYRDILQHLVVEGQLVCQQDYDLYLANAMNAVKPGYFDPDTGETLTQTQRKALKRPRTILTTSQRRAFKVDII